MVSEIELVESADASPGIALPALRIHAFKSSHGKCERCWNLRPFVGQSSEHPALCDRCVKVVATLNGFG